MNELPSVDGARNRDGAHGRPEPLMPAAVRPNSILLPW